MTKKLSALFIALFLLFSFTFISIAASADVSVSTVYGKPGDTVTVMLKLNSNPGLACLGLFVEYDSASLELKDVCDEGLLGVSARFKDLGGGKYSMAWGDKGERNVYYSETGELVSLIFKISDKAKARSYDVKLSYDSKFTDDRNANPVSVNAVNGAVVVSENPPTTTASQNQPVTNVPGSSQGGNQGNNQSGNQGNSQSGSQGGNPAIISSSPYVGQGEVVETVTDKDGNILTPSPRDPAVTVTDKDGNAIYSSGSESITDENGSVIPEANEPGQEEKGLQETDPGATNSRSSGKLKVIIVIGVLAAAFVVIFLCVKKKKKA